MLLELELEQGIVSGSEDVLRAIKRSGFQVYELTRTVSPKGAAEPTDPGSAGRKESDQDNT